MKNPVLFAILLFCLACTPQNPVDKSAAEGAKSDTLPEWFSGGKFGMFIHWGPYSVLGGEWNGKRIRQGDIAEWIMQQFQIPVEEYRKVAAAFNPVQFNAKEWVALARNAGMKYIIITAKHHDGFAMYDSKVSGYNIVDYTKFGRDPLRELSEACAEAGLQFCVYYSHREDWENPYAYGNTWDFDSSQTNLDTMDHPELFRKYLDEKAIPQLKELLTNYGPIGIVWFDRGMYTQEQGKEFADLVHTLQPGCLVNGRVGHYDQELIGDYQSLTDNGMPVGGIEEAWETPQTLNDTWGFSKFDQSWKPSRDIIRRMVAIVSKGGNYLLNVGPTGEGVIPAPSVNILKSVGDWMSRNSESIYETSPSPFPDEFPWGFCTRKGDLLYMHVFDWPEDGVLRLDGLNNRILKAYLLAEKEVTLKIGKDKEGQWLISLPASSPDTTNSVVVLQIAGPPDIDPLVVQQKVGEPLTLDFLTASTHGKAVKRFNRRGEEGEFHISKMVGPEDIIEWHLNITDPGMYEVAITYAAIPGWENCQYKVSNGKDAITGTVKSSPGWYEYKTEKIGQIRISKKGETLVQLYPEDHLTHYLMYFRSLDFIPVSRIDLK
jgi:alpha-L-fucosidase